MSRLISGFLSCLLVFSLSACTAGNRNVLGSFSTKGVEGIDITVDNSIVQSEYNEDYHLYVNPEGFDEAQKEYVILTNEIWQEMWDAVQKKLNSSELVVKDQEPSEDDLAFTFTRNEENEHLYIYRDGTIKYVEGTNRSFYTVQDIDSIISSCEEAYRKYSEVIQNKN